MNVIRSLARLSLAFALALGSFAGRATDSADFHVDTRDLALYTNTVGGISFVTYRSGTDATVYNIGFSACRTSQATVEIPAEIGGCTVRELEYRICPGSGILKLIVPATVTSVCRGAFADASSLQGVYFLGDKPALAEKALEKAASGLVCYARSGRSGWTNADGSLPDRLTAGDGSSRSLRYCWSLTVETPDDGSISGAASGWYPDGTTVALTATPSAKYIFRDWTGDLDGCALSDNAASVPMTRDRTVGATFTKDVYPPTLEAANGETRLEWDLVVGEEGDAAYLVTNPYFGTLSGIEAIAADCPASCEITCELPETIAAESDALLVFHAKALSVSPSSDWETFTIRVTTAEGASLDIPAAFHAASERAALTTVEKQLVSTMAVGEHTEISFTLVNDTSVPSGRIHLNYTAYDWLSLVGPKTLPSLGAGETRTVTLALDPSADDNWDLGETFDGNVVYTCEAGTGGALDFAFTPVSEKTGSIGVVCKDNSGADATYVRFAGASVSLLSASTYAEVASGTTDANGECLLADLPVGRYVIGVTADGHDAYQAVVYVRAGRRTDVNALLNVALVTGRAEFKWIEIEDEYVLEYTPQIVHVVPAPNVEWTLSPRVLAEGATTIVQMHVKNTGLVRATSVTFAFPSYPAATHHVTFSANGFPLEPNEERDVTVRFVCDDHACQGLGTKRGGYATMNVAYRSSDPETGESKTVGYCDGKLVYHGNVPDREYEVPELVFTSPDDDSGDKRTYDPDYDLLNSARVVFKQGDYEADEKVEWPKKARPDAVVPVTLEIQQPVKLKRDVIEGSFVFSNMSATAEAYIHLDIKIENEAGEDCRDRFLIVATNTANDGSVPLDGIRLRESEVTLAALKEGRAGYWFVPKQSAAPTEPVDYYFGGSFVYRIGPDGAPQTNNLLYCKMTVSPMPLLKMDYFTQRDVFSDNPFTDVVEAYQPAEFALRIRNVGGGDAKKVRVSTSQPSIITNESNLQVDYDLRNWSRASYLNGTSSTLDLDEIDLGTIKAGETAVAEWLFVATLEGHFTTNGHARLQYTMPWQNSETTQISEDIGVHLLVHRCQADDDGVVDFLTSEKSTGAPDQLWRSSETNAVAVSTNATAEIAGDGAISGSGSTLTLSVTANEPGPVYVSVRNDDAKLYRVSALKCGSTPLPDDNAWTTDRTFNPIDLTTAFGSRPTREGRIHLFDVFESAGTKTYAITFEPRFVYVVGDEEGGHRVGETYSATVETETVPRTVQRVCSGWTATCDGQEVASGESNEVNFQLNDVGPYETSLAWSTNYWISAKNADNGSVRFAAAATGSGRPRLAASEDTDVEEDWYAAGSNVRLLAVPDTGYCLDHWTGDTNSCAVGSDPNALIVPVDRARTISAVFKPKTQTVRIGDDEHSATVPAAGELLREYWSSVTVALAEPVVNCGATQYVCKGWTAANAEPSSGEGSVATFVVRGDIDLNWLWQTNILTLAEGVNDTNLVWTTGGAREWTPEWSFDAADGSHQIVIGAIGNKTNAWVETTVSGPGTVSFAWQSSLASKNTKLQFFIDDESKGILQYTNDWTSTEATIYGKGSHTLRWRLFTGRSGADAGDCGALDGFVWTPAVPPTLAEALNTNLVWTTEGSLAWEGTPRESLLETRPSWASVAGLRNNEWSAIATRVYGAGLMTFDWAVSCEEDYDSVCVSVDGIPLQDLTGEVEWTTALIEIKGDGWHTVRWEFAKDEEDDESYAGRDAAWLDNVEWISGAGLPPSIDGDPDATVTGNKTDGFVIVPSADHTSVVVTIPSETPSDKVTVVIDDRVATLTPNGATVKLMRTVDGVQHDIAGYLDMRPAADGSINLTQVKVKEEVVRDALDTSKSENPAVVSLDPANPVIQTSATIPGLVYTFSEGTSLTGLATPQQTHPGDGNPWAPEISEDAALKESPSRFFSIGVTK